MSIQLETNCGIIEGITGDGFNCFLGIKYANAERFEFPEEVCGWEGIYKATTFGPACIQRRTYVPESDESFYYKEFRTGIKFDYSESCQFLNIWAPSDVKRAPIIFYIHGGAFQGGASNELPFDGQHFAKKGIIFITCNYRLGPLGFASFEVNGKRFANFGLYDQLTALKWIYHNIEAFGGNPGNIVLMGQSAGAMSVQQLVSSPLAKPYISKAILTSGGGLSDEFANPKAFEDVSYFWKSLKEQLLEQGKDLKIISCKELFDTVGVLLAEYPNGIEYLSPCIDGELLPFGIEDFDKDYLEADIPYLLGTTKDDILSDTLLTMASEWRKRRNNIHPNSAYQFFLARNLPGDEAGAWHSSDLWYTIGNLEKCWRPFTDWDYRISDIMQRYIANFVQKGNPNGEGLDYWGTDEENILLISDDVIHFR